MKIYTIDVYLCSLLTLALTHLCSSGLPPLPKTMQSPCSIISKLFDNAEATVMHEENSYYTAIHPHYADAPKFWLSTFVHLIKENDIVMADMSTENLPDLTSPSAMVG
ncbi:hypothetical protein L0F63_000191 [Massospora cicadina]|nr:hypothetical protein L0F63_000191 [Massospora cicadina]